MRTEIWKLLANKTKRVRRVISFRENNGAPLDLPLNLKIPELPPENEQLLNRLRQELANEFEPAETPDDRDILHLALRELVSALKSPHREDKVLRFCFRLYERKGKSVLDKQGDSKRHDS